jgi:hypothetical protein
MRADLRSGKSLQSYFEDSYPVKEKDLIASAIELNGRLPKLKIMKTDPASADLENSVALYEYYKNLNETQASDPRLWIYLGHVEFRKYSLARWGLDGSYKDLKDATAQYKAINQLLDHWFVNGNDRDLRRHAIARLWWAAHLTYAPWERDPEFFSDLKNKDPYYYTRILLFTQDIYQQVLERAMGRSDRILISILDYLAKNKKFASSRDDVRDLIKELNLIYGIKKIITLKREQLAALISRTAEEITKQNL